MVRRKLTGPLGVALLLASPCWAGAEQEQPAYGREKPVAGPVLAVAPSAGPAGLTVEAKGTGFLGNCGVHLYFGSIEGSPLAFAKVGKAGGFSADVTIPAKADVGAATLSAQGLTWVDNECADPSGDTAEAKLKVTPPPPSLVIDTFEGRPGATVNFRGRGFCSEAGCSTVTILIDGLVVAEEVQVEPDGTLSAQGIVPAVSAAGGVQVEAVQVGAGGEAIRALGEMIVTVRPNRQPTVPQ